MTERHLIDILDKSNDVLLIDPCSNKTYMPLGLMKISSYLKSKHKKVTFSRGIIPGNFDLICVTSMFTTDGNKVINTVKDIRKSLFYKETKIIIGGIFASLMPEFVYDNTGILPFIGYSKILDKYTPDYDTNWYLSGKSFFDYSMIFTTRGCVNKCNYCAVKYLEHGLWINDEWEKAINKNKSNILIFDNNILASPKKHWSNVLNKLIEWKKPVFFDNGIYLKIVSDSSAELLSKVKYVKFGLRLAFDRIEEDGYFQRGMEKLKKYGTNLRRDSVTYVLFNYKDTPQEAYYRVKESWKFGSAPYPMRYRPLDTLKKSNFIGEYWTKNLIDAFRNYCLLYGYNRNDGTFETWMKSDKTRIKLTDYDWDKWYFKK